MPSGILLCMSEAQGLSMEEHARWWKEAGGWQLRQILFWKWDPIGVVQMFGFPAAYDEYDSYAGQIVAVMKKGGDATEVEQELGEFEEQRMGLATTDLAQSHREEVAEFIAAWYPASVSWWLDRR